jgi:hypothetical protein
MGPHFIGIMSLVVRHKATVMIAGLATNCHEMLNCGIMYVYADSPPLKFDVSQHFSDFRIAFDNCYDELIGTSNLKEKSILESKFDLAANSMPFKPFNIYTIIRDTVRGC